MFTAMHHHQIFVDHHEQLESISIFKDNRGLLKRRQLMGNFKSVKN